MLKDATRYENMKQDIMHGPRVTTEYLGTQVIMSMITDSGGEYEYEQVLNTFECRSGLSMSIACKE